MFDSWGDIERKNKMLITLRGEWQPSRGLVPFFAIRGITFHSKLFNLQEWLASNFSLQYYPNDHKLKTLCDCLRQILFVDSIGNV